METQIQTQECNVKKSKWGPDNQTLLKQIMFALGTLHQVCQLTVEASLSRLYPISSEWRLAVNLLTHLLVQTCGSHRWYQ